MKFESLTDVLVDELGDLYSGEQQLISSLPKLAKAAHSYALRDAIEAHLEETRRHVDRLDAIFADMGIRFAPTKVCKAIEGWVLETDLITDSDGDSIALDAALIGAAQRLEHYEIGSYGSARALAGELGLDRVAALLGDTLEEETRANKTLNKLASGGMLSSGINRLAAERQSALAAEEPLEAEPAVSADHLDLAQ